MQRPQSKGKRPAPRVHAFFLFFLVAFPVTHQPEILNQHWPPPPVSDPWLDDRRLACVAAVDELCRSSWAGPFRGMGTGGFNSDRRTATRGHAGEPREVIALRFGFGFASVRGYGDRDRKISPTMIGLREERVQFPASIDRSLSGHN